MTSPQQPPDRHGSADDDRHDQDRAPPARAADAEDKAYQPQCGGWHNWDEASYVDDDQPPGGDRDRPAANRLYDGAGFRELDRLHSYQRP
jgi:hypothetical protein